MSGSNGHKYLTIDELLAWSETSVLLPGISQAAGQDRHIKVRKIGASEYLSLLLPPAPEADTWAAQDRAAVAEAKDLPEAERAARLAEIAVAATARERAWFDGLPQEKKDERNAQARGILYHVAAIAALEPRLTFAQAQRLGEDGVIVALEVLKFSGLTPQEVPQPAESGAAAESDSEAPTSAGAVAA